MAFHMGVVAERAASAYAETLEATTEMLERQAGAGVPLAIKSRHLGGFTR